MEIIFVILIVAGVAGIAISTAGHNKASGAWQAAAQRLGLRVEPGKLTSGSKISGKHQSYSVSIDTFAKSGENSQTYTRYRVHFKDALGLDLRLTRQGPLAKVSKRLGSTDIEVGDKAFDKAVVVKGKNPEQVREFLNHQLKLRIVRFFSLYPNAVINDVSIQCETRKVERDPDRIVRTVQRMVGMASLLAGERKREKTRDLFSEPAPVETLDSVLEDLEDSLSVEPIELDTSQSKKVAELDGIEIVSDSKTPDVTWVQPEYSSDRSVDAFDSTSVEEDVVEEAPVAGFDPTSEKSLDVGSIAELLFAPGLTSSQSTEIFTERFRGSSVFWSGTLLNVRSFRFDLVFGNEPGTRAEFEVLDLESTQIGGRPMKAVVRFPPEAEDQLRDNMDRKLSFSGSLHSCDVFMRTLFVTNGHIQDGEC